MNDVRKALIYGIENPPRGYTLEEWVIISEFASYVARMYDEGAFFKSTDFEEQKRETFEDQCKREYEEIQRMRKEFAKANKSMELIPVDDVVYKKPIDPKSIHRINIDNIKAIDCQTGEIHYEPKADNVRPIKDDRVAEVRIEFKCNECKYRNCGVSSYPCNECEKHSKFEKRKTK